jgi:hypothetical protein
MAQYSRHDRHKLEQQGGGGNNGKISKPSHQRTLMPQLQRVTPAEKEAVASMFKMYDHQLWPLHIAGEVAFRVLCWH